MEVKGNYLRRANLLMHPQEAAGHHPGAGLLNDLS